MYIGIYRRSPVVRFVGGSYIVYVVFFCSSSLSVPYGGSGSVSVLDCFYLFSWFAGFPRYNIMIIIYINI